MKIHIVARIALLSLNTCAAPLLAGHADLAETIGGGTVESRGSRG